MLNLTYDPIFGHKYYSYLPHSKYYLDYNIRGPVDFYEPDRKSKWFPHYWPSHLMEYVPTEHSLRKLRKMLQLKYYPDEDGYNFRYIPDIRFYYDEKIQRPLSSFYDYPYRTRIWVPYKGLRVFCDYMPSRIPFREQRTRNVTYFEHYDTKKRLRDAYLHR